MERPRRCLGLVNVTTSIGAVLFLPYSDMRLTRDHLLVTECRIGGSRCTFTCKTLQGFLCGVDESTRIGAHAYIQPCSVATFLIVLLLWIVKRALDFTCFISN